MPNQYNEEWSDTELTAAVDAYLQMLKCEGADEPYNKAEINRSLREPGAPLAGRTRSSIEYRMQNISAVLAGEKMTTVKGYAPASNVGNNTSARISRILRERQKRK